jgi:hypothetical protein
MYFQIPILHTFTSFVNIIPQNEASWFHYINLKNLPCLQYVISIQKLITWARVRHQKPWWKHAYMYTITSSIPQLFSMPANVSLRSSPTQSPVLTMVFLTLSDNQKSFFAFLFWTLTFPPTWNSAWPQAGLIENHRWRSVTSSHVVSVDEWPDQRTWIWDSIEVPFWIIPDDRNWIGYTSSYGIFRYRADIRLVALTPACGVSTTIHELLGEYDNYLLVRVCRSQTLRQLTRRFSARVTNRDNTGRPGNTLVILILQYQIMHCKHRFHGGYGHRF